MNKLQFKGEWHELKGKLSSSTHPRSRVMLNYAITFFIIAIVAAFLGFSGIAGSAAGIAQILFFVFLVIAAISFLTGQRGVM